MILITIIWTAEQAEAKEPTILKLSIKENMAKSLKWQQKNDTANIKQDGG